MHANQSEKEHPQGPLLVAADVPQSTTTTTVRLVTASSDDSKKQIYQVKGRQRQDNAHQHDNVNPPRGRARGRGAQPPKPKPKPAPQPNAGRGGQQNVAPAPVPAVVQPPPAPRVRTVAGNYAAMQLPLSASDEKKKILEADGFIIKDRKDLNHNTHAVSAGYRYAANAYALMQLYRLGARKIVSVFGNGREEQIASYLNKDVPLADQFTLHIYRPHLVPQDLARTVNNEDKSTHLIASKYDGFLMNDIYAMDDEPLDVNSIGLLTIYGPVMWVGHRFNGMMGTIHGEGAWIRTWKNGRYVIVSQADEETDPYDDHDPLDWLTPHGAVGHVGWTTVRTMHDTVIIKFVWDDVKFKRTSRHKTPLFRMETLCIPENTTLARNIVYYGGWNIVTRSLLKCFQPQRVLIDVRMKNNLQVWLSGRSRTRDSFKQLCQRAQTMSGMALIRRIFPEQSGTILLNTCYAAFYGDAEEIEFDTIAFHLTTGEMLENFNLAQSKIAEKPTDVSWYKRTMLMGTAALTFGSLYKMTSAIASATRAVRSWLKPAVLTVEPSFSIPVRYTKEKIHEVAVRYNTGTRPEYFPPFMGNMGLTILQSVDQLTFGQKMLFHFGSCMLEEKIKRTNLAVAIFFPILELIGKCFLYSDNHATVVAVGCTTVCMHWYTATLPYWKGVSIHWLWNMFFLTIQETARFYAWGPYDPAFKQIKGTLLESLPNDGAFYVTLGLIATCFVAPIAYGIIKRFRPKPVPTNTAWRQFKHAYHETPWEERGPYPDVARPSIDPFDLRDGFIPSSATSWYDESTIDTDITVRGELLAETDFISKQGVWWYLPTCVPFYSAARSDANLLAVVEARILVEPPMSPLAQAKAWKKVKHYVRPPSVDYQPMSYETAVSRWIEKFTGMKRARAHKALECIRDSPIDCKDKCVNSAKVMVKTDEVLCKLRGDGRVGLKPRAIVPVSPLVQATVGPWIEIITATLKSQWCWNLHENVPYKITPPFDNFKDVPEYSVYLTYAGDATDKKLTKWMKQALQLPPASIAILVSGDDSLVFIHDHCGEQWFYECDFKMFDQSQSFGPLLHQRDSSIILGMPEEIAEIECKSHSAKLLAPTRAKEAGGLIIEHPLRPERTTGGPATSFGNTDIDGEAWVHILSTYGIGFFAIIRGFAELGFKAKLEIHSEPTTVTFLKGMWYRCGELLIWGPLISRILKMGKSFTDPRCLYKTKDLEEATRRFANDIAHSYSGFLRVPLVATFVARYLRSPCERVDVKTLRVESSELYGNFQCTDIEPILARYDLEWDELQEMCELVRRSDIGCFLQHDGFLKLAEVDYN